MSGSVDLAGVLAGALIGSVASVAGGMILIRLENRAQIKRELVVRVPNTYQDFLSSTRTMLRTGLQPAPVLVPVAAQALREMSKATSDAQALDPRSQSRVQTMRHVFESLLERSDLDSDERNSLEEAAVGVYQSFLADYGPIRPPDLR